MKREKWKPIWGYTGLYEVSNFGRIRGTERWCKHRYGWRYVAPVFLRSSINECGYVIIVLSKRNKAKCLRVSRVVAKAFIRNPFKLPEVNHIKGNKLDNRAWMLEWSTISANRKHAWQTGLNRGNTKKVKNFLG